MEKTEGQRAELASAVRREFLRGATWLSGALVLGSSGAILSSCARQQPAAPAAMNHNGPTPDGAGDNFYWKGDNGYEAARQNAIWIGNKPKRYPALIVFPKTPAEVGAAVKFAAAQKLKVGVRSGGHSWTAAGVQDGSMLIDLFTWNNVEVDSATKTALLGPGTQAGYCNEQLNKFGLAFPTAHSSHVSLGGFLLCGGFGRNSRQWGIGCENVLEVECVNTAGEVIIANADTNADYYWAARGAGPAFFGIVTRFKIQAHDMPKAIHQRIDIYDIADFDAVIPWTMNINHSIPAYVEPMVLRRRYDDKTGGYGPDTFSLIWVAMGESAEQCRAGLALMDQCPAIKRRKQTIFRDDMTLQDLYNRSGKSDPAGWRYATDGVWSNAEPKQLLSPLRALFDTPTPGSYIYYAMWGDTRKNLPDMALSVQGRSYLSGNVRWQDPADDARMFKWCDEHTAAFDPWSVGAKMNDESMVRRPKVRYFSDSAKQRLDRLTAKYDPDGLFLSFLKPGDQIY